MAFDFPKEVEAIDAVPERFRGLYVKKESGEGFTYDTEFSTHLGGLTSALDKERKAAKAASTSLTSWKALGETPEEVSNKIKELSDAAAKKDGGANFEKVKADMEAAHKKALEDERKVNVAMQATLDRYLVESAATAAIAEMKGSVSLLMPHIKGNVKVVQEHGDYIVRVLDKDGDARSDSKGGFMTIKDYVAELKTHPEFGRAFEASGTSGGGKPPVKSAGSASGNQQLTGVSRIAAGLEKRK